MGPTIPGNMLLLAEQGRCGECGVEKISRNEPVDSTAEVFRNVGGIGVAGVTVHTNKARRRL
jgi:hypothetical protein